MYNSYTGKGGIVRRESYSLRELKESSKCFFENIGGNISMLQRIDEITLEKYNEFVYDISVENNNSFSNYGFVSHNCGSHSNSIDFYMLAKNLNFSEAIEELGSRVKHSLIQEPEQENLIQPNIFSVLLEISNIFRETMLSHPEDLPWINEIMKKTESYINELDQKDVGDAKDLRNQVRLAIKQRYIS